MMIKDIAKLPVLAEGGEGILYEYHGSVVKWYKPTVDLEAKRRKVQLLMGKHLPEEAVLPKVEVLDGKKQFAGYAMNKVVGEEFRMLVNKKFLRANQITTKEILQMLVQVKDVLRRLHRQKIYVGDLNDRNLLFDSHFHIYLIDCDSWAVEQEPCEMAMDLFLDPCLVGNQFNEKTDTYAFCVLAWKLLTRIHPFGGTMALDLSLPERMKRGLSVIGRPEVKIPRTVKSWNHLSPELLSAMKAVFEEGKRTIGTELEELLSNLKYCDKDQEYYDGRYRTCPLCDEHARMLVPPACQGVAEGLTVTAVWKKEKIRAVLSPTAYMDRSGQVTDARTGQKVPYVPGVKYFFAGDNILVTEERERFVIHGKEDYVFEKKWKSRIVVEDDKVYYVNLQNSLTEVTICPGGNHIRKLCQCGNKAYYEASDGQYAVVNVYESHKKLILQVNGQICERLYEGKVADYGIHRDAATGNWLAVLEDQTGSFLTLILTEKGEILYDTDQIRYPCSPGRLCLSRNTIFIPMERKIRGYAFLKDQYKDFTCEIVDTDSRLVREGKGFLILNDDNMYRIS